jgi:hypothetical protein
MKTWHQLQLEHCDTFAAWLTDQEIRASCLDRIATDLVHFLIQEVQNRDEAERMWQAVPLTRACCDNLEIFNDRMAVYAYVMNHFLDRYVRSFIALERLFGIGVLPMAHGGIGALDVGSGPGPAAYAIYDFYTVLRNFGEAQGIDRFAAQVAGTNVAECTCSMLDFQVNFSETSGRDGPFGDMVIDFTKFNPIQDRASLLKMLRRREYFEHETGDWEAEYSPDEANQISQQLHRYRLFVFANVFTNDDITRQFLPALATTFADCRTGAIALVMGALGKGFRKRLRLLTELAHAEKMTRLSLLEQVYHMRYDDPLQVRIKAAQHEIYLHLTAKKGVKPETVGAKEFPDYHTPVPNRRKVCDFMMLVFRKDRPRRRQTRPDP